MADRVSPVFAVHELTRTYTQGRVRVPALTGVDLTVAAGEVVVLAGPSGSAKSTLLHLMAGLDQPDDGKVMFGGRDLAALSEAGRTAIRRRELGFVFQAFNLVPVLTAYENVEYGLWLGGAPRAARRARVDRALAAVGLSHRSAHRPDHLSGGERQRVAIARALVHDPVVILADEPTASLDSVTGLQIVDLLFELNRTLGTTFVLATHDLAVMARAPRVVALADGRVVSDRRTGEAG
jgi:putative ABC transport system ATP-binding protein